MDYWVKFVDMLFDSFKCLMLVSNGISIIFLSINT